MSTTGWGLVELVGHLLPLHEREAVLGDLAEARQILTRSLCDVLGLFFRRQAALWCDWRPWVAGFGVTLPGSYLLIGVSVSVTSTYARLFDAKVFPHGWPTGHESLFLLFSHIFLLLVWAWTAGFAIGSLSRRTLWASLILCLVPCVRCAAMFFPLPKFFLFLFVAPGLFGLRHGLRGFPVRRTLAIMLATTVTILMVTAWQAGALWILNWALILPVWYLAATALRHRLPAAQAI